jgi:hypothetical protein
MSLKENYNNFIQNSSGKGSIFTGRLTGCSTNLVHIVRVEGVILSVFIHFITSIWVG